MRRAAPIAAVMIVLAGLALVVLGRGGEPVTRVTLALPSPRAPALPALPAPNLVKPLSAEEAYKQNMAIPAATDPIEAARAFRLPEGDGFALSRLKAIDCLTAAVYYEAASESPQGQRAVAQVVLNRVKHAAYPKSVCGVVYQGSERTTGCQFSFTCDGSLLRTPSHRGWELARLVAQAALAGEVEPSVGTATHYHAVYVVPYWASSLQKLATLGAHIFYRFPGYWGRRASFTAAYAGESELPSDPLVAAETVLDDAATESAQAGPALNLPPAPTLVRPHVKLAVPDTNPKLQVDENPGQLIADDSSRSGSLVAGAREP